MQCVINDMVDALSAVGADSEYGSTNRMHLVGLRGKINKIYGREGPSELLTYSKAAPKRDQTEGHSSSMCVRVGYRRSVNYMTWWNSLATSSIPLLHRYTWSAAIKSISWDPAEWVHDSQ